MVLILCEFNEIPKIFLQRIWFRVHYSRPIEDIYFFVTHRHVALNKPLAPWLPGVVRSAVCRPRQSWYWCQVIGARDSGPRWGDQGRGQIDPPWLCRSPLVVWWRRREKEVDARTERKREKKGGGEWIDWWKDVYDLCFIIVSIVYFNPSLFLNSTLNR